MIKETCIRQEGLEQYMCVAYGHGNAEVLAALPPTTSDFN